MLGMRRRRQVRASARRSAYDRGAGFAAGVVVGAALWAVASVSADPVPEPLACPLEAGPQPPALPHVETAAPAGTEAVALLPQRPAAMVLPAPAGPALPATKALSEGLIAQNEFVTDVLARAGVNRVEADRLVRALKGVFDFRRSRPGHRYRIEVRPDGSLERFEYEAGPAEIYEVVRGAGDDLVGRRRKLELAREVVEVTGVVERSLSEAFERAGESPALAATMAQAFQYDIDFFHHARPGDRFRLFVERFSHRGRRVRYGKLLAAEYAGVAGGPIGTKRLYWYGNDKTGTRGYYDATGKAAKRAFLRSPLKFSRISSGFGYRVHPILHRRHFHGGVDYAAPKGTPVHAVADGRVTFAARKGPAGKMVKVRHKGGYESYYLHLSRISVKVGQRVHQSTLVGKVGSTGRSTGPHLDFRLKRRGKYLDPTKHVVPRRDAIAGKDRSPFRATVKRWKQRLETTPMLASR